jgi:hypothetical protein
LNNNLLKYNFSLLVMPKLHCRVIKHGTITHQKHRTFTLQKYDSLQCSNRPFYTTKNPRLRRWISQQLNAKLHNKSALFLYFFLRTFTQQKHTFVYKERAYVLYSIGAQVFTAMKKFSWFLHMNKQFQIITKEIWFSSTTINYVQVYKDADNDNHTEL